jgi:DNA-directed DNA polymerase III PolC
MNFVSPCNHPESALSGSTVESMIDRTKKLGLKHFACTDQGYLISVLKAYMYCEKKGIKLIPGVEIFFKDYDCELSRNTPSEKIKYFKLILHAQDQAAYQRLVKVCSNFDRSIDIGENKYPLFDWKVLEDLATNYNITATTSDTQCMVSKHLIVGRADVGMKYYEKLRTLFNGRFYPSLLPFVQNKYWNAIVRIKYFDGKVIEIPAFDRVEIEGENRTRAVEITRKLNTYGKPVKLTHVYVNKIKYPVQVQYQDVTKAELLNDFQQIDSGDLQLKANHFIYALADRFGDTDKLLINSYSFYSENEDKVVQDMRLGEERRIAQQQHIQTYEEAVKYFTMTMGLTEAEVLKMSQNSQEFAHKFDDFKLKYEYRLPDVGADPEKQFLKVIEDVGRMKWDDPRYVKQFKEEYELLTKNGVVNLLPYFLPLVEIFDFYDKNGYLTGPARGSAGGFLLSYLMGITHVNPIKYDLSSSRFLTIDRIQQGNLPDIDSDFESREPLVGKNGYSGFLYGKYGKRAAQLSTRTLLRIKSAILDANRFINKGTLDPEVQQFSKSLPNTPQGITDADYVFGREDDQGNHIDGLFDTNAELRAYAEARPAEWNIVKKALSLSRQNSRHACAYLIADCDIEDVVPTFEIGGVKRVTQPEHKQAEFAKLIKYDFLVVSAVKDIRMCLNYINKKHGKTNARTGYFDHNGVSTYVWDLPEDQQVLEMLIEGKTETVFQLNTPSVTPAVKAIKPKSIIDCATITSLWRPGPLDFIDPATGRNMAQEFIERINGRSTSDIPILMELLPETYGVLVFQEQVSKISQVLGKMNIIDSENVRIAMGKKKLKEMEKLKPNFIKGASETVGPEVAEKIWSMMATFARYGFNKSHAVAYSIISYACAFMKYHYPLEWWAAVLSNADDKEINETFYRYVKDMVLPPDINISTESISIDYTQGKLRNKLSMISGLGKKAAEKIIEHRPYSDIKDFMQKKVAGPELTKRLIFVGVLDSMFHPEATLMEKLQTYEDMVNLIKWEKKIDEYHEKMKAAPDDKTYDRIEKTMEKYRAAGPQRGEIDAKYIVGSMKGFLMKKSIFPTINLDLHSLILKRSSNNYDIVPRKNGNFLVLDQSEEYQFVKGDHIQTLDMMEVPDHVREVSLAAAGYVVEQEVFTYQKGAKKALKLSIDCSGYISEKVIWPDRFTGELEYPKDLKKGCIAFFVFTKRAKYNDKEPMTNISRVVVEHPPI